MARKSMTTLLADAAAKLPDNQVGAISPADVRSTITDFMDTMTPGYGATIISPPVNDVDFTTTPSDLTVWNNTVIQTPEFTVDNSTGIITGNVACVWEWQVNLSVIFSSSDVMTFQTVFSGSTFQYKADIVGEGSGDPLNLNFGGIYDGDVGDTLKIQGFNDSGSATLDFLSGGFIVSLRPLINDPA